MALRLHFEPGTVIGGAFRIVRPLSEGGMGSVYVVEQLSTKKERALKVMRPDLVSSGKMRERFDQEAQIGSKIDSEHVVDVIDSGVDAASGTPWLAMELLKGVTLSQRIDRQGPLSASLARHLFSELCHAVSAAHTVGVVHRDLKPDNIFLAASSRGDSFTVKILDFGIAKLMSEVGSRSTGAIGTPLYMPPEQMVPGRSITPAADVWAIGLIAFYVLTGRTYWHSGNDESSSAMMLLNEVNNLPITTPSARAKELGIDVEFPAGFDEWFHKCVNRVIEYRFANAEDLHIELDAILAAGTGAVAKQGAAKPITIRVDNDTIAAEPLDATQIKGATDFVAQKTAGRTTTNGPGRSWLLWAVAAAIIAIGVGVFIQLTGEAPNIIAASAKPSADVSAPASQAPVTSPPAVASSASDSPNDSVAAMVDVAKTNLQEAHEGLTRIEPLPIADPRVKDVATRWAKELFTKAAEPGPLGPRRALLTKVVNDRLVDERTRTEAFERLGTIEPREVNDDTRHYVLVTPGSKTSADLAPYARAAVVTELATRPDVVVASPTASAYEVDQITHDKKLRAVQLEFDIAVEYGSDGLKVTVTGLFFSHPDRSILSRVTQTLTKSGVRSSDPPSERDLSLIGAQRVAATLAQAKKPAPPPPPKVDSPAPPRKAACNCLPGDPLCSCL